MNITAQKRETLGVSGKRLIAQGLIPAELYGMQTENAHLSVAAKEFSKLFKDAGENTIVQLGVDGKNIPVLIHDVQRDRLTGHVVHVDFYQVKAGQKITTRVPIEFMGESPAVKNFGAVVTKGMNDIEIEAAVEHLPHRLHIDISRLVEAGASLYVKDIEPISGVSVLVDPETVVVTAKVVAETEEKTIAPADVSAVKVETEEKKAQREAKKTEES